MKERTQINFSNQNFPKRISMEQPKSVHHTSRQVLHSIRLLSLWPQRATHLDPFEKKKVLGLKYKGYGIRTEVHPDESTHVSLMKSDINGELRRLIPNEEIFDFIWDIHLSIGHGKVAATAKAVKAALVYSVTEKDVKN